MTDRPLSIAEVLNEELDYLFAETPQRQLWQFLAEDIYDVKTLIGKARAQRPVRYQILGAVLDSEAATAAATVAALLNALLASKTLLTELLKDPEFGDADKDAIVWNDPKLLGGILTNRRTRKVFIEEAPGRLQFLLENLGFLVDAVDEGSEIADLLAKVSLTNDIRRDVRKAVQQRPEVLGAIICSRVVRVYLRDCRACRRNLLRACRDEKSFDASDPRVVLSAMTGETYAVIPDDGAMADERVNALLLEAAFREHLYDHIDEKVAYERLRSGDLTALCLSGGGIRSATFNLGVLQVLAQKGILGKVAYLSTVSGGGYIGSWLSSWMRRHEHGTAGVLQELAKPPNDPTEPEPKPVIHLREYSNYLAPRAGPFTVDMWTLIGTYLRNLSLIWGVLLPPLLALFGLPRLFELTILTAGNPTRLFVLGGYFLLVSTLAIGFLRPVREGRTPAPEWHFTFFLVPGYAAAICFAVALAWHWRLHADAQPRIASHLFWYTFIVLAVVNLAAAAVYVMRYRSALRQSDDSAKNRLLKTKSWWRRFVVRWTSTSLGVKYVLEIVGPLVAAACGAGALYLIIEHALENPHGGGFALALDVPEQFTIFAVPLLLLVLFVEATALVGVVTRVTADFDREWWARSAAMMALGSAAWIAVCSLSLVGPALLLQSPKILGALGGISAIVSAVAGHSKKTPAKEHRKSTRLLLNALATIATIAVLSALALLIDVFLPAGFEPQQRPKSPRVYVSATVAAPAGYSLRVEEKSKEASKLDTALAPSPATKHHIAKLRYPIAAPYLIAMVELALIVAIIAAILFDANDYSMHSMYRNRLIRAYLGGSRWKRDPDRFTNFDPEDNLQMFQLRPDLLWRTSFTDFRRFTVELRKQTKIYGLLPNDVQVFVVEAERAGDERLEKIAPIIFGSINQLLLLYDLKTSLPARRTVARLRANRNYLQALFPDCLEPVGNDRPPLHVLNMALNLVSGDNLAWQQRKAESFTVSMLHSGSGASARLGYRDSVSYGGTQGISLGTAMAISGAAVSPNQGYNSSAVVTFIMTLFNARLGWWLGNPGTGQRMWTSRGPDWALEPLINEAFGQTDDRSRYVFLSDGGHFENLGIYEMVRRRCRSIIVCDAAADPKYEFGDLGNAIRKIRVDFGIPIKFEHFCIGPDPSDPTKKREAAYCAIGIIDYAAVDSPRDGSSVEPGKLLYIKPVVYSDCPADVKNYERTGPPFPQETTADQFFDETQFESYRMLGMHIASTIAAFDVSNFVTAAEGYLTAHRQKHGC